MRATFIFESLDRKCLTTTTTQMYDQRTLHDHESASFAVQCCSNSHFGDFTRFRVVGEPARSFAA